MIDQAIYYAGIAVMAAGAGVVAAAVIALAGCLVMRASTYLLQRGLMFIRLRNWYYWNERMSREGLICMQTFYREQVAIHKPKTLSEFHDLDISAAHHERQERAASNTGGKS